MKTPTIGFSKLMLGPTVGTEMKDLAGIALVTQAVIGSGSALGGGAPGQFVAPLSGTLLDSCKRFVGCGDARHTNNPSDYIVRKHWTGKPVLCLPRSFACETKDILLIFSTREAYLADPDRDEAETARINAERPDYVVVWVVASGGNTEMPGNVFLRNLAGHNNAALAMSADAIRAQACKSVARDEEWCLVAD